MCRVVCFWLKKKCTWNTYIEYKETNIPRQWKYCNDIIEQLDWRIPQPYHWLKLWMVKHLGLAMPKKLVFLKKNMSFSNITKTIILRHKNEYKCEIWCHFKGNQNDSFQSFFLATAQNLLPFILWEEIWYEKFECKFHLVFLYMRRKRNLQLIKIRVKIVVMANVAVVHTTKVERKYYLHRF